MIMAAQQNSMIRRNHERDLRASPPNAMFADVEIDDLVRWLLGDVDEALAGYILG